MTEVPERGCAGFWVVGVLVAAEFDDVLGEPHALRGSTMTETKPIHRSIRFMIYSIPGKSLKRFEKQTNATATTIGIVRR
jgi:hypothetical protein